MTKSTKQVKRPQLNVFIPELDKKFSSASQAAKALIENVTGAAPRLQSISGRVSRAYHSGGSTVLGFTVIPVQ